jgi:hypothetical protein
MAGPSIEEKRRYSNEWILVCKGKIIKHSKDVVNILKASEDYKEDCYIEKVIDGQVCFY